MQNDEDNKSPRGENGFRDGFKIRCPEMDLWVQIPPRALNMSTPDENRKKMESMLHEIRANQEMFEMSIKETTKMLFFRFETLQEAGFTKKQAFKIICKRGLA